MTLRQRLLWVIGSFTLLALAHLVFSSRTIVLAGFEELEADFALRDASRAVAALDAEILALAETAEDYAYWNDTIDWLEGRAPGYVASNLTDYTFEHLDLQAVLVFDTHGEPFWSGANDPVAKRRDVPAGLLPFVSGGGPRLLRDGTARSGLLHLPEGSLMVAVRPVLDSDGEGPARGTVVFARFLDAKQLANLAEVTHSELALVPGGAGGPAPGTPTLRVEGDRMVADVALVDLTGATGPFLRQTSPRAIYAHGRDSVVLLAGFLVLAILLWAGAAAWFLDRKVLRRLTGLGGQVERIAAGTEPSRRVAVEGNDELTALARRINSMLERLERARAEKKQLAQVVEESSEGVLLVGEDGRVRYANAAAQRLAGLAGAELVGQPFAATLPGVDIGPLLGAGFRGAGWEGPLTLRRKDGAIREVRASLAPLREVEGDRVAVMAMHDVTRERQIESQLHQVQKMDAVGRLAGGVAHDFNNLLTVILSCTRFLEEELDSGDPHREEVREIGEAANRAAALTRQLLAFSRKSAGDPGPVDLNETVAGMERMLRRILGEDVLLAAATAPELWSVRADPGQLEQVIVNFAVNARDAMPDGGRLTIATANVLVEDDDERPDLPSGEWVSLSVSDTGRGMPPEILAHLFEPFFTTKAVGKGTGLGLSTVWGIVRASGGRIRVESEEGKGSTFTVFLPRAHEVAESAVAAPAASAGGRERILVVEDEPAVRRLARRILERQGYEIAEAGGVDEALRHLGEGSFDLVLSDVVMPGGGGRAVLERVRTLARPPRVLLMSGHTGQVLECLEGESPPLLQKPFTPEALARHVRETLDAA